MDKKIKNMFKFIFISIIIILIFNIIFKIIYYIIEINNSKNIEIIYEIIRMIHLDISFFIGGIIGFVFIHKSAKLT